jgi:membrane fusion protein (multidrug efflux system)
MHHVVVTSSVRRAVSAVACLVPWLALSAAGCEKEAPPPPPPPEVLVAEPIQRDVPVFTELVGQTLGSQDVEIRARVEGYVESVAFAEGTLVKKGQLLYQIDPKPLEAVLANAKADLAKAQADFEKTKNDVARLEPLAKQQAVSQQELDNARSARDAAAAMVEAKAASVEKAQLDLGYATITSPVAGLIGTTKVKAGSLVGRGESTLMVTVSVIDPIYFRAGLAEAEYLRLARQVLTPEGDRTRSNVPIELILADGTVHPQTGHVDAIERNIDPTTGTLAIQVGFPNPGLLLRPGQYGRARFQSDLKKDALLVPQRAVQELQNLYSVAVVGADRTVSFRNVKVGPREGSLWVIEEGLEPGDSVIVEGVQRVREGMTVSAKPAPPAAGAPAAQAKEGR